MLYIGIDTGTHTGLAIAINGKLESIQTLKIHEAMNIVKTMVYKYRDVVVYFEDARQRKWFGNSGRERLKGAGSIERDCNIWDDFLKSLKVEYYAIPPKNNITKLSPEQFARFTGWKGRTSEHGRDAAMLIFCRL